MTHEIQNALSTRLRHLPERDGSRYSTYRLVVNIDGPDYATVSLIHVDARNNMLKDSRLWVGRIPRCDDDGNPVGHLVLLQRALNRL